MIDVHEVTQHYGVRPVLKKVSLQVDTGELLAIIGPNGMGKSTLLSVMAGVLSPQAGYVAIDQQIRRSSPEVELAIRHSTVYLPDRPWLPTRRTGREYLMAVGQLYDIPALELMDHIDRLLVVFELGKLGDSPISDYSAGQQKKIALCSVLVTRARHYLLDEPFSGGLDPSGIMALKHILKHLVTKDRATVVFTTPVPELLEELADRIAIIRDGELISISTAAELRSHTGISGGLDEVIASMLHPETMQNLQSYFEAE